MLRISREVLEDPRKQYFRIRKSSHHKFHIAKRIKSVETFKALCGMRFTEGNNPAIEVTEYDGHECRRCQRATKKIVYARFGWFKRIIRIPKRQRRCGEELPAMMTMLHADAGQYRLRIRYAETRHWEWDVLDLMSNRVKFAGDSDTLDGAKLNAAVTIGLFDAQWIEDSN